MTWKTTRLRSAAEVTLGRQRSPEHANGIHMRRYLRAANVKDGVLDLNSVLSMNFTPAEQEIFSLRPGDVLVSEGSGSLRTVGATAVWHAELDGTICFQNTLLRLRPRPGTDPEFLGWWARAAHASGLFASIATGANIYHISAERVRALPIDLPPMEEQRRIADFLEGETVRLGKLRAMALRLRDLLQARRKAVIFALVTGADWSSKVSSGLPWVESIPAHWRSAKINYFARMGSGHTPSRNRPEWWINPEFCWITTGEVAQVRDDRAEVITEKRERISKAGLENSSAELHPAGTVVLCRTASAGYSAVMGSQMATSQDFVTWTCGEELDPFYLLWCLRAMRDDLLGRLATGSTHKTIYVPDLQMLKIPVPPISEQQEIVARIRASNAEMDALLDLVDKQLKLLEERRRALITAAVTGQLDVTTARGA